MTVREYGTAVPMGGIGMLGGPDLGRDEDGRHTDLATGPGPGPLPPLRRSPLTAHRSPLTA
ncbi:hypothetical protein [Streptomyces sp. NPDC048638]|uniref:hypothetical protein n=1 Tax=Streptomyces sp. NPDC048638 TaxID=3365580 RepID=UPI00371D1864